MLNSFPAGFGLDPDHAVGDMSPPSFSKILRRLRRPLFGVSQEFPE